MAMYKFTGLSVWKWANLQHDKCQCKKERLQFVKVGTLGKGGTNSHNPLFLFWLP